MRTALAIVLVGAAALGGFFLGEQRGRELATPPPVIRPGTPLPTDETQAALHDIFRERDVLVRVARLGALFQRLDPSALPAVRDAFSPAVLDSGAVELILLAEWWAEFDPAGALQWSQTTFNAGDDHVTSAVFRAWARKDAQAARAKLQSLPFPNLVLVATDALIQGWDESGQPGLMDFVRSQPRGKAMQLTLASLARRRLHRLGPAATIEWAESFPDDVEDETTFKLNVYRRVAGVVAEVEPERAAAFAVRHREGDYGHGLVRRVAVRWGRRDGRATLEWLRGLTPGKDRKSAIQDGFGAWYGADRTAAIAWLTSQPNELWLSPAHALHALGLGRDPDVGMQWAEAHVLDEEEREYTINQIGRSWYMRDPEAARPWLESRPQEIQDIILDQAQRAEAARERQAALRKEQARRERAADL
jgi:hypothetical protein